MIFYYLNTPITNPHIAHTLGVKTYGEINIHKSSLKSLFEEHVAPHMDFQYIENIEDIPHTEERIIIWPSKIATLDWKNLKPPVTPSFFLWGRSILL